MVNSSNIWNLYRRYFWLLLALGNIGWAQEYSKNKSARVIKIDAEVSTMYLELGTGQKINAYPYTFVKDKTIKGLEVWQTGLNNYKSLIETDFVKNIFVTDGLKNCATCKLKFEERDEYQPEDFYINYKHLAPFSGQKAMVRILEPQFNIPAGEFIGKKIYTVFKSVGETQVYDPVLGSKGKFIGLVEQYLGTSEYSFVQPKVFDRKLTTVLSAQSYLWLEPNVEAFHFYIWRGEYLSPKDNPDNTGYKRYTATADLYINWKFSGADKQLEKVIPTRVVASSRIADPALLFESMVKESLASLLSQDSLQAWIVQKNSSLSAQFGLGKIRLEKRKMPKIETSKVLVKEVTPAVVTVHNEEANSFGSGFVVSDSGYIVTNYHVIEKGGNIKVQFHKDTAKYRATIVQVDEDADLALLKVKFSPLTFLNFGNSEEAETGETVYAIGTPAETKLGQSVSKGIISAKREWEGKSYLQTDVSINPGNSGGPLVNEQGEVVGIVALKFMGREFEGLSFVIPSNIAMQKLGLEYK